MSTGLDASCVSALPDEVLRLVFASFEDPATLVRCEATCTSWRRVIGEAGDLWMNLYAARWRDFLREVSPRERPASSPPRVDPVAASILDAHGSWRRLVTARAEVDKFAEALVDSMGNREHRATAREDARASSSPLIDTAGPCTPFDTTSGATSDTSLARGSAWSFSLRSPSSTRSESSPEKSATAPPATSQTRKTPDDASKFPNASPPSYPRSSPTTWTGNASTRRRVWTVYDERTRRIRRRCSTRWTSSARNLADDSLRGAQPRDETRRGERRAQPPALLGENDRHRR